MPAANVPSGMERLPFLPSLPSLYRLSRRGLIARVAGAAGTALSAAGPHALGASLAVRAALAQAPGAEPADWDVPEGHFYSQTAPPEAPAGTGFVVADADGVGFWRDYQALGGPGTLGYPLSTRYEADGITYQAFQAGLLRWDADAGRTELAPVFARLAELNAEDWAAAQGIPTAAPQLREAPQLPFDARAPWLTNPTLRDAYVALGGADDSGLLGLPMSEPQRFGPYLAQRFEGGVLQLWLEDLPQQPDPGTISLIQSGDLLKAAGLIPEAALVPQPAPAPAPQVAVPVAPAVAAPAPAAPAAVSGQGKSVVVSLGQQWWYAYQDGALVYSSAVTTGRPELATPRGRFTVLSRHTPFTFVSPWPAGNRFWYAPSPCTYALRITGNGVFLHDSPWRAAYGPGTNLPQGVGSDGELRTGSHGCINLPFAAAQFLWGFAPIGTVVDVVA